MTYRLVGPSAVVTTLPDACDRAPDVAGHATGQPEMATTGWPPVAPVAEPWKAASP